jgi:uncharacterized metal-binding protein
MGRTHDAITLILTTPAFALTYFASGDMPTSIAVTASFAFGGFMFGPDLDIRSNQYARWGIFRSLWLPYRLVFKHRSRWSHGLIFGTLFRVVYSMGVITLAAFLVFVATASISGAEIRAVASFGDVWRQAGESMRSAFGNNILLAVFIGMWAGAASHTFTDMAGSYIKTGRVTDFL